MGTTTTARLGLVLPDDAELLDELPFNGNLETIDDNIGLIVCTSSTQPSSPYGGQGIYETDTRKVQVRNASNLAWVNIGGIPIVAATADITAPYNGQMCFNLADGTLYRYQTSNTTWYRYPDSQMKYKAATESVTSSTTLQNDDIFSWSVLANSAYALSGYVVYDGAQSSAGGLKTTFTGPASSSMFYTNFGGSDETSGSLSTHNMVIQGLTGTRNMPTQVTASTMSFSPKGTLVVGVTAGTLQFQWAQAVSNGTATRIMGGSWMKLEKIA